MAEQQEPADAYPMRRMVELAEERTRLAHERTSMAADRSEMSAERSYMAAERTLSVWVRTALALMVFGVAVDKFGLFLDRGSTTGTGSGSDTASLVGGAALVVLGVLMAVVTGIRFLRYARAYRGSHNVPAHHGPFLAPAFAVIVAAFGVALLVLLLAVS